MEWHRIAYIVLMVLLRIYSLTHSLNRRSHNRKGPCSYLIWATLQSQISTSTFRFT